MTLKRSAFGLSLASIIVACSSSTPNGQEGSSGGTGSGTPSGGTGPATGGAGPAAGGSVGAGGLPGAGGASGGTPSTGTGGAVGAGGTSGAGGSAGAPPVVERPPLIISGEGPACAPTLDGCTYWKTDATPTDSTAAADVTVTATTKQVFAGFGGSFNEAGWKALLNLTAEEQTKALSLLYDAAAGAHFVYGRIPIGASDYAVGSSYSLQESATAAFSIERDKNLLIPFIKAAQSVSSNITFWGSPWSPPPWMKSNNAFNRGEMKAEFLDELADYLSNFVEAYGGEGIPISAIAPQNEPGYGQDYPSCAWPGDLMKNFIPMLAQEFQARSITADIILGTMSNSTDDATLLKGVMQDATAKPLVKGYGLQWGMLSVYSSLGLDPSLKIWQTEHKCGNYTGFTQPAPPGITAEIKHDLDPAPNDHAYAQESWGLIREWIKAGVNAYSAWNMVLDTRGVGDIDKVRIWPQNSLLTVDVTAKKLLLTPTYFVFRHVSQYVDPGATRLDTTGGDALAFKNLDGSVTTVLFNNGDAAKDITVSVLGKNLGFNVPARGFATLNVKP